MDLLNYLLYICIRYIYKSTTMKKFIPHLPGFILSAGFGITAILDMINSDIGSSNLIFFGVGILFFLQTRFNLYILTCISSSILVLICGYFFLALISEYNEFEKWTNTVWLNFLTGCLIICGTGVLALLTNIRSWSHLGK